MPPRSSRLASRLDLVVSTLVLLALCAGALWLAKGKGTKAPPAAPAGSPHEYLFCHWNVENLYDDDDDPGIHDSDEDWFGSHPELVREKVALLAAALLRQGKGRGPDILAMVEVESRRAVELLRDALNDRLSPGLHYRTILQRDNQTGRHFAPAILTRLAGRDDLTRTFGARRMLEAHLEAEGSSLVVLSSHWTSRMTDATEIKRDAYADALYRAFLTIFRTDRATDVLMPGDFNDEPDDPSLREHLHVTDEPARVRSDEPRPRLLDLMAGRDPEHDGTYFHRGRWEILDHIVASPGLLDARGWQVLPETLRVRHDPELRNFRDGSPRRFGTPRSAGPRGPSDHFAITVRLRVAAN
jgi:endonuclease/exonuclease/phosphatase family metal-dependent hydrolase